MLDPEMLPVSSRSEDTLEPLIWFLWRQCLWEVHKACVSDAIDRPVLVCSPPSQHKDFNDWWIAETKSKGHQLSDSERRIFGERMHAELLRSEEASVIEANVRLAQEIATEIELNAVLHRASRQPQNVDMDFDTANSCTYRHIFRKSTKEGDIKLLGSKLACKSWKCSACRKRLLTPNWSITLITAFSIELKVYTRRLCPSELASTKRFLQRQKARWATIQLRRDEETKTKSCLAIANKPMRGCCNFYAFFKADLLKEFSVLVRSSVALADYTITRPISTSKGISPSERASRSDWLAMVTKIIGSEQKIFAGMIEKSDASIIRRDAYQSHRVIGRSKEDCLTIDQSSGLTLVISSKLFECDGLAVQELVRLASNLIRDETTVIKATPRWYARKTKGWARTGINKGPSELRAIAKRH